MFQLYTSTVIHSNLAANLLTALATGSFATQAVLHTLLLQSNFLSTIEVGVLPLANSLDFVDLSNTRLAHIPAATSVALSRVTSLYHAL
eukprot:m.141713 g.141713  ORF g.141713 m.141713 type:complete len:89 (+) comp9637_c0_seq18:1082-1348(+)